MNNRLPRDANRTETLRVVYFGTPSYAIPTLERMAMDPRVDLRLVVTQPDRPAGRRHQLTPPPVKIVAEQLGLQVYQPVKLRTPEAREPLVTAEADMFVVAAYGLIFGPRTLAIPQKGCLNLHASLLPRYRGASPIAAAILEGDAETGVSLMRMDEGLDTGPVYSVSRTAIEPDETTASLTERLAIVGADLIGEHLMAVASGELVAESQPAQGASLTRPLTKADGAVNWTQPAETIERQVRALWPWPRAWAEYDGQRLQIHRSSVNESVVDGEPGDVSLGSDGALVKCGAGSLQLDLVQGAGGKPVSGQAWLSGRRGGATRFELPADIGERSPIVTQL